MNCFSKPCPQSHVVHADEAGRHIARLNAWLWVFSSKEAPPRT